MTTPKYAIPQGMFLSSYISHKQLKDPFCAPISGPLLTRRSLYVAYVQIRTGMERPHPDPYPPHSRWCSFFAQEKRGGSKKITSEYLISSDHASYGVYRWLACCSS